VSTEVAFKVDVCNHRALHEGLPRLLRLLDDDGVRAAIFVAFGPDHSGRAIRRLCRPGFLKKMMRTRAVHMYGLSTLFRGTLLPALPVGESAGELLRSAEAAGHCVGLHGFDHVAWQDGVARMDSVALRASYTRAIARFEEAMHHPPRFTGAPGWQVTASSLAVQEEFGFAWASDTRDGPPFFPALPCGAAHILQIPTTLPTSDELLAAGAARVDELADWYDENLVPDALNVIGLHAEAEGLALAGWLRAWLRNLRVQGVALVSLSDIVAREREQAALRPVVARDLPGRSGSVSCPETSS